MTSPSQSDAEPTEVPTTGQVVLLEGATPLSECLLWKLQHDYYERSGVAAWSSGDVPFSVTSAPVLARAYVQLIEGFVQDCLAGRFGPFDPDQPVYLLDLGAGAGRLAYYCVEALASAGLGPAKVVYVLTDRVAANLEFWTTHPKLSAMIEGGRADVARYEIGGEVSARLVHSGVELAPGKVVNPMIAVANYLFDVLPQDLFATTAGRLEEELVEIFVETEHADPAAADFFEHVYMAARHRPADPDRLGDRMASVLREVAGQRLAQDQRFLFPRLAIRAVDQLRELSCDRLLFLIAEREEMQLLPPSPAGSEERSPDAGGAPSAEALSEGAPTTSGPASLSTRAYSPDVFCGMGVHGGSISLPVDMGIVADAARLCGATMLRSPSPRWGIFVGAVVAGDGGDATALQARFANSVVDLAPGDVYIAIRMALLVDEPPLDSLLAALRVSGYDANAFAMAFKKIAAALPPPPHMLAETVRVLERIEERNFTLVGSGDVAYAVAALLGRAAAYESAIVHYEAAIESYGPRADAYFNVATCHLGLEQVEHAVAALSESLRLDPSYEPALRLRAQLDAGILTPPSAPMRAQATGQSPEPETPRTD